MLYGKNFNKLQRGELNKIDLIPTLIRERTNMKKLLIILCLVSPIMHAMEEQEMQERNAISTVNQNNNNNNSVGHATIINDRAQSRDAMQRKRLALEAYNRTKQIKGYYEYINGTPFWVNVDNRSFREAFREEWKKWEDSNCAQKCLGCCLFTSVICCSCALASLGVDCPCDQ